jgi:hypothetical protein
MDLSTHAGSIVQQLSTSQQIPPIPLLPLSQPWNLNVLDLRFRFIAKEKTEATAVATAVAKA